jgi:hypothetical protein
VPASTGNAPDFQSVRERRWKAFSLLTTMPAAD